MKMFPSQKILTHSYSRVVLRVLEKAAAEKKRFSVYVTESQPDSAGWAKAANKLCACLFSLCTHVDSDLILLSFRTQAADGKSSAGTQCSSDRSPGRSHRVKKPPVGSNKRLPGCFHPLVCFFNSRYVLEKVDLVIVGAEGVVESGGIINKVCLSEQSCLSDWRSPDPFLFELEVI